MKSALVIRHVPHEGVAGFRAPIEAAGYRITRVDVTDAGFAAVDLLAPDLVIMMGGPMGVYDTDRHPWIACELRRLARRLTARRPTLGVCLGAQMIAAASGARVFAGPVTEIGFAPVELTCAGRDSPVKALADIPVLHFHGDTFDLPVEAELLASSAIYPQAFRIGSSILALQCHPEMGEDPRIEEWLADGEQDLGHAGITADAIRKDYARLGPAAVAAGRLLISRWLAGLDGGERGK